MKIQQLIEEQQNRLKMIYPEGDNRIVARDLDAMILSNARKLIRALGEELTNAGDEASDSPGAEFLRAKQRAKLKELLSNIT